MITVCFLNEFSDELMKMVSEKKVSRDVPSSVFLYEVGVHIPKSYNLRGKGVGRHE